MPFPQHVMEGVARDVELSDVLKNPDAFRGAVVIWGGVIIETIPKREATLIIVRQAELDYQKRPHDLDRSVGRFIIRHEGFLDPAIYEKGREVTVVGEIVGTEERPVGEHPYKYPVVKARSLRLWEMRRKAPYYDPFYYDEPFYPWHPYPWHPYPWSPYPWYRHPYWW